MIAVTFRYDAQVSNAHPRCLMAQQSTVNLFRRLEQLNGIGAALSRERNIDRLLENILEAAKAITGADGGTLYSVTEDASALKFEILRTDSLDIRLGGTTGKPIDFPHLPLGNAGLVLFLVVVTQGSDVLQYIWGKLCGRRKIAPTLSPGKTWEGFIGGVLSASLLGASLHWLTPCHPWQAFVVAMMLCALGFLGGLIMSAIKRERGIKDWGTLIEGHGGILDRIDSLCFSTPLYFHIMSYCFGSS